MLDEYVDAMNKAKRPVILAGWGVRASGAVEEFKKFIRQVNIPVLLTWKGIDILDENYPNYCGRPGSIGQRAANIIIQKADFLLVLGCRLDPDQVGFEYPQFAPHARKVIVDIDINEANKFPKGFAQSLVYDIKEFLKDSDQFLPHSIEWLLWCKELNVKYPALLPENLSGETPNLYHISKILSEKCTKDDVLAIGSSGPSANIILQTWKVKDGQRFIFAPAIGAMGSDIPSAIGACLASGRKRTICVTGDGGFQLNAQELEVINRLNLPIKIFVAYNKGYGSIATMQDKYFGHRVGADEDSGFTMPSITNLALAYQIPFFWAYTVDKLPHMINFALNDIQGPTILEIETPLIQNQFPRCKTVLIDGNMKTAPFEDQDPPLPAGELEKIMVQ